MRRILALVLLAGPLVPAISRGDDISTTAIAAYQIKEQNPAFDGYASSPLGDQLGWGESYVLMGLVSMYEATGTTARLDRAMSHADLVLANRNDRIGVMDEIRNRVMPAWTSTRYTNGVNFAFEVHAGMVAAPIARSAYLVRNSRAFGPQYHAAADRYVRDLTDMAIGFEEDWRFNPSLGEGYYASYPTGGILPYNQFTALGRTYVQLYLATGEARFRERAVAMAKFFKNDLRLVGDRYDWAYSTASGGSEDLSHAAINADFAFECYRAGIVFNATDMSRFANTFLAMTDGNGGFYANVSGTTASYYPQQELAGMWGHLGYINPVVRTEFFKYYKDHTTAGGYSWGGTVAAYLAETAKAFSFNTPALQPGRQRSVASIELDQPYFAPVAPGPRSTGLASGSGSQRDSSTAQHEDHSLRITAIDNPAASGAWRMEIPAATAPGGAKLTLDRAGYVGFYLRTEADGVSASLLLDDLGQKEQSTLLPLIADGQWHLYQWNLDNPDAWSAFSGAAADGALGGLAFTLDSIFLHGSDRNAVVYLDNVVTNLTGPIVPVPEPTYLGACLLLVTALRRRRC